MRHKSTIILTIVFVVIAATFSLQGCSHKSTSASTSTSIDRALVIGISVNQDNENTTLPNAATDAEMFGKTLSSSTKIPSRHLRIITAKDEQQTRENLLNELHQFAGQTSKSDVVWLAIEGQGVEINGEDYFYTSDSTQEKGTPTKETLIGEQDILQALDGMHAKELIITLAQNTNYSRKYIIDDPFAAYAHIGAVRLSGDKINTNWKIPAAIHSMVTFSFSGLERNFGGVRVINPLIYYLAKGLEGGAADQEGKIKIKNLLHYVQLGVSSNVQLFGGNVERCAWSVAPEQDKAETLDTILVQKLPPGLGGTTAVSPQLPLNNEGKRNAAMLRAFELQMEIAQSMEENGKITEAVKSHTLLPMMRSSFAPVRNQFLKALHYDPKFPLTYSDLGILEIELHNWGSAQTYFQNVMKRNPQQPIFILQMAVLMQDEKKYREAESFYKKAIALTSNNIIIRYYLAGLYIDAHEFDKAQKLLSEIMKEDPKWVAPINKLSYVYYDSGDETKAMELLQQAYKLDPDNTGVIDKIAWNYCHKLNDYKKSDQLYRKLINLAPATGAYRRGFAECLLLEGKTDEAKSQAKKAIALGCPPTDPLFKKLKLN